MLHCYHTCYLKKSGWGVGEKEEEDIAEREEALGEGAGALLHSGKKVTCSLLKGWKMEGVITHLRASLPLPASLSLSTLPTYLPLGRLP